MMLVPSRLKTVAMQNKADYKFCVKALNIIDELNFC